MYTFFPFATRRNSASLSAVCLSIVLIAAPQVSAAWQDAADANILTSASEAYRFAPVSDAYSVLTSASEAYSVLTSASVASSVLTSASEAYRFAPASVASSNQPERSSRRPRGAHEARNFYSVGLNIGGGEIEGGLASGFQLNLDSSIFYGHGFGTDINIGGFGSSKLNSSLLIFGVGVTYNFALDDPHHNIYTTLGLARVIGEGGNADGSTTETSVLGFYFGIGYSYVLESGLYFYIDLSPIHDTYDILFLYGVGVGFRIF